MWRTDSPGARETGHEVTEVIQTTDSSGLEAVRRVWDLGAVFTSEDDT